MGKPHRFETGARRPPEPGVAPEPPAEAPVEEISEPEELKVRLAIKNRHIQELYEELAGARLSADEVRAVREVGQRSIAALEEERDGLQQRVRDLERELQGERERAADADELRRKLEEEYERRRRLAAPKNRLRAGIELFNATETPRLGKHPSPGLWDSRRFTLRSKRSRSRRRSSALPGRALPGRPTCRIPGSPLKSLACTWRAREKTYPGSREKPPNAHVGAGGRVLLGV